MTPLNKNSKHKYLQQQMNGYLDIITLNCTKQMPTTNILLKMNEDIPNLNNVNCSTIIQCKYNLGQLKYISTHYKLKVSGSKDVLIARIYSHLHFKKFITKIQKLARGIFVRRYLKLRGPAIINHNLCVNAVDFITMEPVEEIPFSQFISYTDSDRFIYGFDISSLYNLFLTSPNTIDCINPYNRNVIPTIIIQNIQIIVKLSALLKIKIDLQFEDGAQNVSIEKAIELRALGLFQTINALGNYSDPQWFNSLNKLQLIKFLRELIDIWNYRAQISLETKRNICPPAGNPFIHLQMEQIFTETNLFNIKNKILEVLERLVNNGINDDSKTLGSYYILGALTLVNVTAAETIPWLLQSFAHF